MKTATCSNVERAISIVTEVKDLFLFDIFIIILIIIIRKLLSMVSTTQNSNLLMSIVLILINILFTIDANIEIIIQPFH